MCFSNPKNPKIQKSKVSWEIVRRTLGFWVFGFLDFWVFGLFGLEKHIQDDKYLQKCCAIRKKAPKSAKSTKKCNKCKKMQKSATSTQRAKKNRTKHKRTHKAQKSTKNITTNAQEAQKAQRSGQGKHGRVQCLENLGHVDVGPLGLEVGLLGGATTYIYRHTFAY